jgi:hypothetical protein
MKELKKNWRNQAATAGLHWQLVHSCMYLPVSLLPQTFLCSELWWHFMASFGSNLVKAEIQSRQGYLRRYEVHTVRLRKKFWLVEVTLLPILLPVGMLVSEICGPVSVVRPLWREDGSAICSVITHWSESLRTRNPLLSHLRLLQHGGLFLTSC